MFFWSSDMKCKILGILNVCQNISTVLCSKWNLIYIYFRNILHIYILHDMFHHKFHNVFNSVYQKYILQHILACWKVNIFLIFWILCLYTFLKRVYNFCVNRLKTWLRFWVVGCANLSDNLFLDRFLATRCPSQKVKHRKDKLTAVKSS